MKALLYKQMKLVAHPMTFCFAFFGVMFLIPSYPYTVIFFYTTLGIFFTYVNAREQRDADFSSLLPIRKSDTVVASILFCAIVELMSVVISLPFAILSNVLKKSPQNMAGIDINPAVFGFAFILYGLFNLVFFTSFYKNGYKAGVAFIKASIVSFFVVTADVILPYIPIFKWLDNGINNKQIYLLVFGIVLYLLLTAFSVNKSKRLYGKVDL